MYVNNFFSVSTGYINPPNVGERGQANISFKNAALRSNVSFINNF